MIEHTSLSQSEASILRGQLTIAEDALHELANVSSYLGEFDEKDITGPIRIAEGALKRIREYGDA